MSLKHAHAYKGKPKGRCRWVYAGDMGERLGRCNGKAEDHEPAR